MKLKKKIFTAIAYSLCLLSATAVISSAFSFSTITADEFTISETTEDYGVMPASDDPPTKEKK